MQFITRLRRQPENCTWDNPAEPIRNQAIDKCRSADLRPKLLLKGTHLTLEKVQQNARSFEAVDIQLRAMTGAEEDRQQVNRIEQGETADQFKGKGAKASCYPLVVTVVVRRETPSVRGVTRKDILLRFAETKDFLHEMCQRKGDRI